MKKTEISTILETKKALITDGATGSNLQQRGLAMGLAPEHWVLENPDAIMGLHTDFIEAGSDIILTCTFGANRFRLEHEGLEGKVEQVNTSAVSLARKAIGDRPTLLAGSMGPLGQMLKPLGLLDVEVAKKAYAEQAAALSAAGVDLLLVETQFDIAEATSAIEGIRSESDLPIICSFSYDRGTKTMMGVSPTKMAQAFASFDLFALGINCGKSLEDNLVCLQELKVATDLPIWFKPNAGLPGVDAEGNAIYDTSPKDMADQVKAWIEYGVSFCGGCCGTSPDHLKAIADKVHEING